MRSAKVTLTTDELRQIARALTLDVRHDLDAASHDDDDGFLDAVDAQSQRIRWIDGLRDLAGDMDGKAAAASAERAREIIRENAAKKTRGRGDAK